MFPVDHFYFQGIFLPLAMISSTRIICYFVVSIGCLQMLSLVVARTYWSQIFLVSFRSMRTMCIWSGCIFVTGYDWLLVVHVFDIYFYDDCSCSCNDEKVSCLHERKHDILCNVHHCNDDGVLQMFLYLNCSQNAVTYLLIKCTEVVGILAICAFVFFIIYWSKVLQLHSM